MNLRTARTDVPAPQQSRSLTLPENLAIYADSHEAAVSPLVTVIISVHNEESHLAECLQSLKAQSYSPVEILVVDDGSTDGSREVARRHGVRLLELPHRGKATAVNFGAQVALGEILLFLDGDMVFEARYVEQLVAPILAGEALGTAHAEELVANPENRWARCLQAVSHLPRDRRFDLSEHELGEGSVVYRAVRRSDFLQVGGFDERGYVDDQTLCPKLGKRANLWPTPRRGTTIRKRFVKCGPSAAGRESLSPFTTGRRRWPLTRSSRSRWPAGSGVP